MAFVHGFPPIADPSSRLLILGSMPGKASLRAGEYYAHPRNAFWKILGALLDIDATAPYQGRVAALRVARIAVWDVLASCTRETSLDSDIDEVLDRRERVPRLLPNPSGDSYGLLQRSQGGELLPQARPPRAWSDAVPFRYHRLPSTSPAHAAMSGAQKVAAWQAVLDPIRNGGVGR